MECSALAAAPIIKARARATTTAAPISNASPIKVREQSRNDRKMFCGFFHFSLIGSLSFLLLFVSRPAFIIDVVRTQ
jgi:hypothetical protein